MQSQKCVSKHIFHELGLCNPSSRSRRSSAQSQAPSSAAVCSCRCKGGWTMLRCRRQVVLPRRVVYTVDQRPVVEARTPGGHMQAQCTPGRQLSGRASRLNFASSSEKPSRPTRCSRQRVARASLPIVPGRNAANGRNIQLPRPPEQP